jgi:Patatin-like phospholipase
MSAATARSSRLRLVPTERSEPAGGGANRARTSQTTAFARQAIALEDAVREGDLAVLTTLVGEAAGGDIAPLFHATHLRALGDADTQDADRLSCALANAIDMLTTKGGNKAAGVLVRLRAAFGETGLMLSGGGKLGNYHIGVVRLLLDQGLLPRVISGSSAGSLIAALIGTRTDTALGKIMADEAHALAEVGEAELDDHMFTALTGPLPKRKRTVAAASTFPQPGTKMMAQA